MFPLDHSQLMAAQDAEYCNYNCTQVMDAEDMCHSFLQHVNKIDPIELS